MKRSLFSSLRIRLIVLVLFAVLPALGLTSYADWKIRRLMEAQAQETTLRLARLAAGDLVQVIEGARQLLVGLAQLPEVRQEDPAVCGKLFADLLRQYPHYMNLGVVDRNGFPFCSGRGSFGPADWTSFPHFQRTLSSRNFTVSDYLGGRFDDRATIIFSYPVIRDSGAVQAVVFSALDLNWFNQLETEAQLPPGAVLLVLDRQGTIVARYPDQEKWSGKNVLDTAFGETVFGRHDEGVAKVLGVDGVERLYGFTRVCASSEVQMVVSIGVSEKAAFEQAGDIFMRNLRWLGVVGFLALSAAWFGGRLFIVRPVQELVRGTQQLAAGNLSTRLGERFGHGEFSRLAQAFDEMAESLEKHTSLVHQAETKYRTLVEQIPMITYITPLDKTAGILYISPQVEAVLGYAPEAWTADPNLWLKRLHPEDSARVLEEVRACGAAAPFRSEYRMLAQDGRCLWFRDEAVVVKAPTGEPQFLQGILDDISERKHVEEELKSSREQLRELAAHLQSVREEERTWIAREIHDELGQALTGLKMDLAWLDKRLRQGIGEASTVALSEKLRSMTRLVDATIQTVRRIATALRPGILDDLGLMAAIEWLVVEFQERTKIRCNLHLPSEDVSVDPERASAVFRILQEILTNVARHAQASRVEIHLIHDGAILFLDVLDNGKGITREEIGNTKSLGLLGMRERALILGGQFQISGTPGKGTRVMVRIPASTTGSPPSKQDTFTEAFSDPGGEG